MKIFRGGKITEQQMKEMRKLRKEGLTYCAIAKIFGVSNTTVRYHTSDSEKKRRQDYSREFNLIRYKEGKQKPSSKEYRQQYMKDRYNNDEEFRKRMIGYVRKSQIKKAKANE